MRIELDEGAWAEIRDPRKLTGRQTELVEDAQFDLMATPAAGALSDEAAAENFQKLPPGAQMNMVGVDGMRAFRNVKRATVLAYVSAWSYGEVTLNVMLDLVPTDVIGVIGDKVGEVVKATGGPKVNTEPTAGPEAPSSPSSA